MKNIQSASSSCLVAEFGPEMKQLRRNCRLGAAKSLTRFTIILTLTFMLAVVQFLWVSN